MKFETAMEKRILSNALAKYEVVDFESLPTVGKVEVYRNITLFGSEKKEVRDMWILSKEDEE